MAHHDYAQHAKSIESGDELKLARDPTNCFDDKAVKVLYNGEQIGWIPREKNKTVAALLDHGFDVRTWVISHDKNGLLAPRLYVSSTLAREE